MFTLIKMLMIFMLVMVSVAFLTLLERKILSFTNMRLGPIKVSFLGILQPMLDAMKISNKQTNSLSNFSFFYYYFSAMVMIFSSLMLWSIVGIDPKFMDVKLSMLFFFLFLSIHTINTLFSGWSTFSKYSMLASLRMVSNLISYEIVIFMIIMFFMYNYCSFSFYMMNMGDMFMIIIIPLCFLFWMLSCLAELNRTPFDYSESESELVSGFNIDYGSKFFSIIFISEYSNILFFSFMTSLMFFFFNFSSLSLMFIISYFFIIWIRSVLPRMRYDLFMNMCWKFILPFLTLYFCFFVFYSY